MKKEKKINLRESQLKTRMEAIIWGAAAILIFLVVWELIARYTPISEMMPGPVEVLPKFVQAFVTDYGIYALGGHILASLGRVLAGFAMAAGVGIVVGILMGTNKIINAILRPFFEVIRPIPGIAWIPIAILWLGTGEASKLFIIFIATVVVVLANTYAGTVEVDPQLVGAARMLGASERQIFVKIVLPSCVPYIFAGLQTGLSVSWMVIIAAEMIRSEYGVGWLITAGSNMGDMTQIIIGLMAIAIVGLILATLLRVLERRLCVWKER